MIISERWLGGFQEGGVTLPSGSVSFSVMDVIINTPAWINCLSAFVKELEQGEIHLYVVQRWHGKVVMCDTNVRSATELRKVFLKLPRNNSRKTLAKPCAERS